MYALAKLQMQCRNMAVVLFVATSFNLLAQKINRPKAVRAVGSACGANPLPLIIPCHRVVAKGGLGGFGLGLEAKKILLSLENPTFDF